MRLFVRPEAEADLRDAYPWYEHRRRGLGAEFVASVESAVLAILDNPTRFPVVHHDVRRALVRRFPFRIFFVAEPDEIIVLAILHAPTRGAAIDTVPPGPLRPPFVAT